MRYITRVRWSQWHLCPVFTLFQIWFGLFSCTKLQVETTTNVFRCFYLLHVYWLTIRVGIFIHVPVWPNPTLNSQPISSAAQTCHSQSAAVFSRLIPALWARRWFGWEASPTAESFNLIFSSMAVMRAAEWKHVETRAVKWRGSKNSLETSCCIKILH